MSYIPITHTTINQFFCFEKPLTSDDKERFGGNGNKRYLGHTAQNSQLTQIKHKNRKWAPE
jgi:hypothetical protein